MSMSVYQQEVYGVLIEKSPYRYDREAVVSWIRRHSDAIFHDENPGFEVPEDDDELLDLVDSDYEVLNYQYSGIAAAFCSVVNYGQDVVHIEDLIDDNTSMVACGVPAARAYPWKRSPLLMFGERNALIVDPYQVNDAVEPFLKELSECDPEGKLVGYQFGYIDVEMWG